MDRLPIVLAAVVGISAFVLFAYKLIAKYWPRLQHALLTEDQRRRLASYQRQAYANVLTSHEAKLRAAAQAKRKAALATWHAGEDHTTTLQRTRVGLC